MDRETMKTLAHGIWVLTHRGEALDQKQIQEFVSGALWAYDLLTKPPKDDKKPIAQPKEFPVESKN